MLKFNVAVNRLRGDRPKISQRIEEDIKKMCSDIFLMIPKYLE